MGIGSIGSGAASVLSGGSLGKGKATTPTDEAEKLLSEMTSGGLEGYWRWLIKNEEARIRADVMQGMGLSEEQLAAMPDAQRQDLEKQISDAVAQRLKVWLEKQMQKEKEAGNAESAGALSAAAKSTGATGQGAVLGGMTGQGADTDYKPGQTAPASLLPFPVDALKDGQTLSGMLGVEAGALPHTAESLREAGYDEREEMARRLAKGAL